MKAVLILIILVVIGATMMALSLCRTASNADRLLRTQEELDDEQARAIGKYNEEHQNKTTSTETTKEEDR